MQITFGMQLDGQRPIRPGNRLGSVTVGPQGLLEILETQLGLVALKPCAVQRAAAYRDCLAQAADTKRFYLASFLADELGVAAELLSWRDDLYLHGWDGNASPHGSARISDLADVEQRAKRYIAPSVGERLRRIASTLQTRRTPIEKILLADNWQTYPRAWQAVLQCLPYASIERPSGRAKGFLGQLQAQLQRSIAGEQLDPLIWQEDGTVQVVQAQTRALAASWLSRSFTDVESLLLVSSQEGDCLDAHMVGAGRARQGLDSTSALRPALQVLPLAMELLWAPRNYSALLQFLTHSICPIRTHARRKLAAKIAASPGVEGVIWEDVIGGISQHYGEEASQVLESITAWIQGPTYSKDQGAPLEDVLGRVRRLSRFFQGRMGRAEASHHLASHAGHAQCTAIEQALETLVAQCVCLVRPRQLQQMVEQATGAGNDNPLLVAQVGAQLAISRPGAAIEHVDTVVWWNMTMPVLPGHSVWSNAELKQLEEMGVAVPTGATLLAQASQDWLRPLLAADRHLVLVLGRQNEESHPLWQMVETLVDHPKVKAIEALLIAPSPLSQPHRLAPLPLRKRWWKLPDRTPLSTMEKASFSSLNLFLFNPYQWLLHYGARIRPSQSLTLGDSFKLKGKLAHRIAERFFTSQHSMNMSDGDFSAWFAVHFDQVIREEGAVLLMDGRGADLASFRHRVRRALKQLLTHFSAASVQSVICETQLEGQFAGGVLAGSADLIITKADGHQAVVDMKWAGGKTYPDQLKGNRHLQLAIYAELLRQTTGSMPSVGYFILDSARLLTPDDRAFADSECIPANPPGTTRELWQSFTSTWAWRQAQIAGGEFEVALEGIEKDELSVPPAGAMSMEYLKESYNHYLALAGWEQ
ncbi:PD-(D/E)XK nuclease family protein [Pseudomonas fluorescens]|nr:PD-(D/E)XK nuclease family protein [Pseudomonas fluorescens]